MAKVNLTTSNSSLGLPNTSTPIIASNGIVISSNNTGINSNYHLQYTTGTTINTIGYSLVLQEIKADLELEPGEVYIDSDNIFMCISNCWKVIDEQYCSVLVATKDTYIKNHANFNYTKETKPATNFDKAYLLKIIKENKFITKLDFESEELNKFIEENII